MSEFNRRALYKNNDRDFESQRRNRNDHSVEIRKAKKEDQLQKRRNIDIDDLSDAGSPVKENVKPQTELSTKEIGDMLRSGDMAQMVAAATSARKQLSKARNPPIDEFYDNGLIPVLVKTLTAFNNDSLIFETAWALTNIASGDSKHTAAVVDAGAVPLFIELMAHESDQIAEQSVWALSNIAGDSAQHRDLAVKHGIVAATKLAMVRFWSKPDIFRHLCWLVSNLCRHKGRNYPIAAVLELLPLVREILSDSTDAIAIADLTWALAYACDSRDAVIDSVIELGILPLVNANLGKSTEVMMPSLRTLGNVVAGTNEQADAAVAAGVIASILPLLRHSQLRVVKESCWLVSNLSAGTDAQVGALVDSGVILAVLEVMKKGDYKSQKEAAWAITNMVTSSNDAHKFYLLNNGVFEAVVQLLSCDDASIVMLLLDSVKELFRVADSVGQLEQCVEVFEKVGGVDVIEQLQNHESHDVYTKSFQIVKEYLGGDEEEDEAEENAAVGSAATDKFKF